MREGERLPAHVLEDARGEVVRPAREPRQGGPPEAHAKRRWDVPRRTARPAVWRIDATSMPNRMISQVM